MKLVHAAFRAIAVAAAFATASAAVAQDAAAPVGRQPERKIFAHYMGCFPAAAGALSFHWDNTYQYIKGEGYLDQLGGNFANWPLVPHAKGTPPFSLEDSARLEISRAQRYGFDGFAFDAWAGDNSRDVFETYFKVAEEMGTGFQLTVCFDASCHWAPEGGTVVDAYVQTAEFVLKHAGSPNLATFGGKPLFFGYYSNAIDPGTNQGPVEERLAKEKAGWDSFREKLGTPVFLHGSLDAYNGDWEKVGAGAAKIYDAVGSFLGGGEGSIGGAVTAKAVKDGGAVWSQPLSYQYANKSGWIISWGGLDLLRLNWKAAIENDSRLIQFVTWNDYGEESGIAPTTGNGYSVIRVNKYFIDLWKNGAPPAIERDEIHLVYRRTAGNPPTWPLYSRRLDTGAGLQVITLLTAPATIDVPGYGSYEAPAGIDFHDFALQPGPVSATASRDGAAVCAVKAPEPASDRRWREDNTLVAFGTGYEEEWEKDFPDCPVETYAENADDDGDGMPNWFEMFFFGRFPDRSTATAGDPDDDPDVDFATNLEEYRASTDPTRADEPYRIGYTWDSRLLNQLPFTWNPMRDDHRRNVWHSLVERAAEGKPISFEGNWAPVPLMLANAKNRLLNDWNWATTIKYGSNGAIELANRADSSMLVGWEAPIDGEFEVAADFHAGYGNGKLKALLLAKTDKGVERLEEVAVAAEEKGFFATRKVTLSKGDMLLLASDVSESQGINPLVIDSFTVKLVGGDAASASAPADDILGGGLPDLF